MIEISERNAVAQAAAIKLLKSTAGVLEKQPVEKWVRKIETVREVGDIVRIDVTFWMYKSPSDTQTISLILAQAAGEWKEFVGTMLYPIDKAYIWDFGTDGTPVLRK